MKDKIEHLNINEGRAEALLQSGTVVRTALDGEFVRLGIDRRDGFDLHQFAKITRGEAMALRMLLSDLKIEDG